MRRLERRRHDVDDRERDGSAEEFAEGPQPERDEPRLPEPPPTALTARDYLAILRRS